MRNKTKLTAVEWLEQQTRKPEWHSLKRGEIFEQAKEMEKEQRIDFAKKCLDNVYESNSGTIYLMVDELHNKIYGGNK